MLKFLIALACLVIIALGVERFVRLYNAQNPDPWVICKKLAFEKIDLESLPPEAKNIMIQQINDCLKWQTGKD